MNNNLDATGHSQSAQEREVERALRPKGFDSFAGQQQVLDNLRIFVGAAKQRREPLDHVLLFGPPGLGKTTLSYIIANELGVNIKMYPHRVGASCPQRTTQPETIHPHWSHHSVGHADGPFAGPFWHQLPPAILRCRDVGQDCQPFRRTAAGEDNLRVGFRDCPSQPWHSPYRQRAFAPRARLCSGQRRRHHYPRHCPLCPPRPQCGQQRS